MKIVIALIIALSLSMPALAKDFILYDKEPIGEEDAAARQGLPHLEGTAGMADCSMTCNGEIVLFDCPSGTVCTKDADTGESGCDDGMGTVQIPACPSKK